jgi:hypothetical protein
MEYHGKLASVDSYMNVKLTSTEEWKDGKNEGQLGEVFIRYVLFLRSCPSLYYVCCPGFLEFRLLELWGLGLGIGLRMLVCAED